jgi:hypothetical protein
MIAYFARERNRQSRGGMVTMLQIFKGAVRMTSRITSRTSPVTFATPPFDLLPRSGDYVGSNIQLTPDCVLADPAMLAALYRQTPEAALFILRPQHLRLQQQHGVLERTLTAYEGSAATRAFDNRPSVIRDAIEQAVKFHEEKIVKPAASATSTYTKYVTALSQMLTEIQGMPTAESNGNSNMQGPKMLRRIAEFIVEWNRKSLGVFTTQEAATELANQFKAGTVKVHSYRNGSQTEYRVEISVAALAELTTSIADSESSAQHMKALLTGDRFVPKTVDDAVKSLTNTTRDPDLESDWRTLKARLHYSDTQLRDYLLDIARKVRDITWVGLGKYDKLVKTLEKYPDYFDEGWTAVNTRRGGVSPQIIQAFGLAADDVRKTHDTDANLLMDHYRRSLGEYNSRLKMVSSMISGLAETYRMALP